MLERSLDCSSQELFQVNADLRALFDAFPDIFFRITNEGIILDCRASKSAELFLSTDKLIGKKIQDAPFKNFRGEFEQRMTQAAKTKKIISFEYETRWEEETHYFEARMISFLQNQLMVVVRNIDDRKKMETQLIQSQKMESVGQLAAGVAHEINNPMGVILGFAQGLVKRVQPGDVFEMPLKSIEREAIRCKQLVQNLLTFSRSGKAEETPIDLKATIEIALSLVSVQAKMKNVELVKEYDETLPEIVANQGRIEQVIINLCNNAIDAMEKGGRLTVRTKKINMDNKEWAQIEVRDTGPGIPEKIRSKIFEPFFTTKAPGKGTGLGLSLVYELVQKHGGKIDMESQMGQGTIFRVDLPIQQLV